MNRYTRNYYPKRIYPESAGYMNESGDSSSHGRCGIEGYA